jgi:phosphate transport system permease protein
MALEEYAAAAPLGVAETPAEKPAGRTVDLQAAPARDGEWLVKPILFAATLFSGLVVSLVVAFVIWRSWGLWQAEGLKFLTTGGWDQQLQDAWNGSAFFGAAELIFGSLITTVGAVLVAVVVGLGAAVFLAELCPRRLRGPIGSIVQLMAGIPSVVFGLVGLAIVVPYLMDRIPANAGEVMPDVPLDGTSILAGIIVLTFMILPFFVAVAVDALKAVPRAYLDGGMALGMTRWRAITRLQLPSATPGLVAGVVLAASRGIGEAIAMSMVAGSLALIATGGHGPLLYLLQPVRTIASAIVETGADASDVPSIATAMFALASVLLVISLVLSLGARVAFGVFSKRMSVVSDRRV